MKRKILKAFSILIAFSVLFPIDAAGSPSRPPGIKVLENNITVRADVSGGPPDQWQHKDEEYPDVLQPLAAPGVEPGQFRLEKTADLPRALPDETVQYTITLINDAPLTTTFELHDPIPENASYVEGSAMGGLEYDPVQNALTSTIDLDPPRMAIASGSLFGYLSLPDIDVDPPFMPQPCPNGNCDDGAFVLSGFDFYFFGQHVTDLVWSTNGYLQVGVDIPDLSGANQDLPDPAAPNNLIAPLWTDLDLDGCVSGSSDMGWYRAFVTDGVFDYYVFEWKEAALKNNPNTCYSFQVWIKARSEEIWLVYGPQNGAVSTATVGVENLDGSAGYTYYFNGSSSAPVEGTTLKADRIDRAIFTYQLEVGDQLGVPVINKVVATNKSGSEKLASVTVSTGARIFFPVVRR